MGAPGAWEGGADSRPPSAQWAVGAQQLPRDGWRVRLDLPVVRKCKFNPQRP